MALIDQIKLKAKASKKHILLPEGTEERTVQAARIIIDEGLANVSLMGKEEEIKAKAKELGVSLDGIGIIHPETHADYQENCGAFYEMRKQKGVTEQQAAELMKDPLYFACMLIKNEKADDSW